MNDPVLHLLGLARKAGKVELGEEPVGAACRARFARLVLLADDAAPNTHRRGAHFGEAGNVLQLALPFSKAQLGALFGRSSCAMLALTDIGFASSLVKKLAARDSVRYGNAAQLLGQKADKALQRQKEQRRHEKKLREGRAKPWAAPPPSPAGKREKTDVNAKRTPSKSSRQNSSKEQPLAGHKPSASRAALSNPRTTARTFRRNPKK